MFHLIQKMKEKKSRLRFFRSKNFVHSLKRTQTRSDKSDLKQHSFLTAHFTAFFGYINEVAYLVDSGQLIVQLEKQETLNEQRSTLNTKHFQLSTINYPLSTKMSGLTPLINWTVVLFYEDYRATLLFLVESWELRIDSSARETRNAKRATFNTKH